MADGVSPEAGSRWGLPPSAPTDPDVPVKVASGSSRRGLAAPRTIRRVRGDSRRSSLSETGRVLAPRLPLRCLDGQGDSLRKRVSKRASIWTRPGRRRPRYPLRRQQLIKQESRRTDSLLHATLHANLEICVILVILEKRKSLFP